MLSATTLTGIVDGYRRTAASRSALVLVVANLIPLGGVLFFGWSLWTILVLYWLENGIVGVWAVARILTAAGPVVPGTAGMALTLGQVMPAVRPFVAAFFLVHYGLFWLVHGVFVFALPSFLGLASGASMAGVGSVTILFGGFAIAFLGAPVLLLVVMVLAKTAFDLSLHLREHPTAPE
jgi:hypothetical protein